MLNADVLAQGGKSVRAGKYLTGCLLAVTAAVMTGCVQTPTRTHLVPQNNDGGVLLKISDNLPISAWTATWGDSVTVRRIPDEADQSATCYYLHRNVRGLSASSFLGAALPPGTYEFPTIGAKAMSIGDCNKRDLLKASGSQFGKFTVSPGRLTYLGVLERTGGSQLHQSYMIPMLASAPDELGQVVHEVFPDLEKLTTETTQGWVGNSLPPGRAQANRYALVNSYGLFSPSQAADGTWIFGSRTGVIRSWSRGQASASEHDTGHRVSLVTTAVLPDGSWLVGGEQSTLLDSTDEGRSWQSMRGDLPYGLVAKIAAAGQEVLLTLIDGKDVFVYRGDVHSGHWRKAATYSTEFAHWTGMRGVTAESFLVGDKYLTTLPSRRLGIYDLSTGASQVRDMPGSIAAFNVSDDHVLRCRCAATIAVNPYESSDFGNTWKSSAFSRYMALPGMADAKHGVTLYKKGLFDNPGMAYTQDGGQTWQPSIRTSLALTHFFYSRDRETVYASNDVDTLWVSHDGGRHWNSALSIPLPAGDSTLL